MTQSVDNLKQKSEIVLIKPIEGNENVNDNEIKLNVTRALEKVKSKLKIKNIRQTNRKGLVIEVDSIKNKEIIKVPKLEEIGLRVEGPRKIEPMIIIYDMEKEYKLEELKDELLWKNSITEENIEEFSSKINFKYSFSTNNPNRLKTGLYKWMVRYGNT